MNDHKRERSLREMTMHERMEIVEGTPYCDPICCCEAEPRWRAVEEEQTEAKAKAERDERPGDGDRMKP